MEKRKFPRIAETVPCQLTHGGKSLSVVTRNISCGGALCELNQSIPVMTRLEISLVLPAQGSQTTPEKIRCRGIVVRQETVRKSLPQGKQQPLLTAIYFSEIDIESRRKIAQFVLNSMLSHDRRRS